MNNKSDIFYKTFIHLVVLNESNEDAWASVLLHLCKRSTASDKTVRARSCQWISAVLSCLEGAEISDAVSSALVQAMLLRVRDKVASVRVWAVAAAGKLYAFEEESCLSAELVRLMESDSSREVRAAAVQHVFLDGTTLPSVVERVKDISAEVRLATYELLQLKVKVTHVKTELRAVVVQYGLNDRDPAVRAAARELFLCWLHKLDNNMPRLLYLLGLERNEAEAEMLAHCVLESAEDPAAGALRAAVWDPRVDWAQGAAGITAADVLWTQLRCDFALKRFAPATSADIVEHLAPGLDTLCSLLEAAYTDTLGTSALQLLTARYLLRLCCTALGVRDGAVCEDLVRVCEGYIRGAATPDTLLEGVLAVWAAATGLPEAQVLAEAQSLAQSLAGDPNEDAVGEDDEEAGPVDGSLRSLQICTWLLQRAVSAGGRGGADASKEVMAGVQPLVLAALSQPLVELRVLAVRCLGLLCLGDDSFADLREVILQSALTEAEDLEVRSQALQAAVDLAAVFPDRYRDDRGLAHLLMRILEGADEPILLRQAAEGSARLLFASVLSEPRLFAQLTKMFFQPALVQGALEAEGEKLQNETFLGSPARLQQMLAIFFRSYFIAGNGREQVALDATAELVADVCRMVRLEEVEGPALQKVPTYNRYIVYLYCTVRLTPFVLCADGGPLAVSVRPHAERAARRRARGPPGATRLQRQAERRAVQGGLQAGLRGHRRARPAGAGARPVLARARRLPRRGRCGGAGGGGGRRAQGGRGGAGSRLRQDARGVPADMRGSKRRGGDGGGAR